MCCNATCYFRPATFVCRAAGGQCDSAETCTGASSACPANGFLPLNTPCDDGDACTVGDVCSVCTCNFPYIKTPALSDCILRNARVIARPVDPNEDVVETDTVRAGESLFFAVVPRTTTTTESITVTVIPNNGAVRAYAAPESITRTPSAADATVSSIEPGLRQRQELVLSLSADRFIIGVASDTTTTFDVSVAFTIGSSGQVRRPAPGASVPGAGGSSSSGGNGGVIAAAILVPLIIIAAAAAGAAFWYRRREASPKSSTWDATFAGTAYEADTTAGTYPGDAAAPTNGQVPLATMGATPGVVYVSDLSAYDHYATAEYDRAPEDNDELALTEGKLMCVVEEYPDGWGLGFFPTPPFTPGAFPLNHVARIRATVLKPHVPGALGTSDEIALAADDANVYLVRDDADGTSLVCHIDGSGAPVDVGRVPSECVTIVGRPMLGTKPAARPAVPPMPAGGPASIRSARRGSRTVQDFDVQDRKAKVPPPWVKRRNSGIAHPNRRSGAFSAANVAAAGSPPTPAAKPEPRSIAARKVGNAGKRQSRVISDFDLSSRKLPPVPSAKTRKPLSVRAPPSTPAVPAAKPADPPRTGALDSSADSDSTSGWDSS
ncbi:uncharacterized protein AMSG_11502 [Thecamonas trahens ATCC 50062]|uniref:SH3 domain-containing protein n=1 Tax=Thecamonas trahens ATCC 50062 TaxID=461836 RepID=A0A0L0DW97_THETB|nr:hypothetical protein AMSG_11502 [Thecamonas trahens ATCC 50062]KNC56495.1 hypothetical protein AMSG_11502 [Thecamonas trahens ATCC 50062]|eukprot:XP_013752631.1 hypothetical protein AMSG_11502 [Thecamonas trahens ATCC 50062]